MHFLQLILLTAISINYYSDYVASKVGHTQRASKSTINRINALLNEKIQK